MHAASQWRHVASPLQKNTKHTTAACSPSELVEGATTSTLLVVAGSFRGGGGLRHCPSSRHLGAHYMPASTLLHGGGKPRVTYSEGGPLPLRQSTWRPGLPTRSGSSCARASLGSAPLSTCSICSVASAEVDGSLPCSLAQIICACPLVSPPLPNVLEQTISPSTTQVTAGDHSRRESQRHTHIVESSRLEHQASSKRIRHSPAQYDTCTHTCTPARLMSDACRSTARVPRAVLPCSRSSRRHGSGAVLRCRTSTGAHSFSTSVRRRTQRARPAYSPMPSGCGAPSPSPSPLPPPPAAALASAAANAAPGPPPPCCACQWEDGMRPSGVLYYMLAACVGLHMWCGHPWYHPLSRRLLLYHNGFL